MTSGSGSPDTLQVSVKLSPTLTLDSLSGSVVILGGTVENKKRRLKQVQFLSLFRAKKEMITPATGEIRPLAGYP